MATRSYGAVEASAEIAFSDTAKRWPGKAHDCLLASASLSLKWGASAASPCLLWPVLVREMQLQRGSWRGIQEKHGEDIKNVALCGFYNFYCLKYGGNPRLERPPQSWALTCGLNQDAWSSETPSGQM